jgi:hypothetical protein
MDHWIDGFAARVISHQSKNPPIHSSRPSSVAKNSGSNFDLKLSLPRGGFGGKWQ